MSRIKRAISGNAKGISIRTSGGLQSVGVGSMFGLYSAENYASAFPSVRAISSDYMQVQPFAIDGKGETVQHDVINALMHPNLLDSWVAFAEKTAVSTLSLSKTYILVHRLKGKRTYPGGDFRKDKIGGFTFLEFPIVTRKNGRTYYKVGTNEYSEREVLVLPGGVNPVNLYGGYSPSEAARRWITLDDYIADFQKGFFENNAIPSGVLTVAAGSMEDYDDTVAELKRRHRGAGNANNITYAPRQVKSDGSSVAQIEWTPFGQANKDIGFKELFEQANRRIDQAYGVAPIIKGTDSTAKYDNANVSEYGFAKRTVYPLLLRNYTQLTHELNRITGGMGIAIAFDYKIPEIADEKKVNAETDKIRTDDFLKLKAAGYSDTSIVAALDLPERFLKLSNKEYKPTLGELDLPEIDDGNEVAGSPDPIPEKYKHVHSDKCSHDEGDPSLKVKRLSLEEMEPLQAQAEAVILKYMAVQVERAIEDTKMLTDDELVEFANELYAVLLIVMVASGALEYAAGLALLAESGIVFSGTSYGVSEGLTTRYKQYLNELTLSYSLQTEEKIIQVLATADVEGWNRRQIDLELRQLISGENAKYRQRRLAISELNRSQQLADLDAIESLSEESGIVFRKVWNTTNPEACPVCVSLNGTTIGLTEPFIPLGGEIELPEGGVFVNNFMDIETAQAHPQCYCVVNYEVVM